MTSPSVPRGRSAPRTGPAPPPRPAVEGGGSRAATRPSRPRPDDGAAEVALVRPAHADLADLVLGALTFLALACAAPLGLASVGAAPAHAEALTLTRLAPPDVAAPLAALWGRLFALVPFFDLPTRVHLGAAVAGGLAACAWARFARSALVELRPPRAARQSERDFLHETFAAAGAAFALAVSLGGFAASSVEVAASLSSLLVGAGLALYARVARAPADARAALAAAFVAGASMGAHPVAAAILLPPGLVLWLWALRKGERWPLVAPALVVAAGLVVLAAVPTVGAPMHLSTLLARLGPQALFAGVAGATAAAAAEVGRLAALDLGVLALLLGVLGFVTLAARVPAALALAVWSGWAAVLVASATTAAAPRLVLVMATAPLVAAGIAKLATALGRGRVYAAAGLAVMVAAGPLLEGGIARFTRPHRLPEALLRRAHEGLPARARVEPGSDEMTGLFFYGRALGQRPDLDIARR